MAEQVEQMEAAEQVVQKTYLHAVKSLASHLETLPFEEALSDYGLTFTQTPPRDMVGIAWLLALRKNDRQDKYLVVEKSETWSPGCGGGRSRSVKRLVVDLKVDVARAVHNQYPIESRGSLSLRESERSTAHSFFVALARTPRLIGEPPGTPEAMQAVVDETLYRTDYGSVAERSWPVETEDFDQHQQTLKVMLRRARIMEKRFVPQPEVVEVPAEPTA